MTKKIGVSCGISGTIHAGSISKDGTHFLSDRQDVTIDALVAVSQHVLNFGEPVVISDPFGDPEFKIIVEKLQ